MTGRLSNRNRIMVVDDDEGIRISLGRILRSKGLDTCVAKDGEEAEALAQSFQPHVVVLDMRMPGLDGVDTFKSIRRCCPQAVGIFMTAYTTWHRTDDALREGGLAVLPKPLQLESLCQLISQVVHEQRDARG